VKRKRESNVLAAHIAELVKVIVAAVITSSITIVNNKG
jgi:hypothetical protein